MVNNIWVGGLAVILAVIVAVGLSIALRRKAPSGGFFNDSDRAAGIFGSIGTLFSVLLALVILLSVETYSDTKSHANAEADAVLEQFQLARLFPSGDQYLIQSQLVCYGRGVIGTEWRLMRDNKESAAIDEWAQSIDLSIESVEVRGPKAEAAFGLFLEQTLERQEQRRGRIEGAEGSLPPMVWPILVLGALIVLAHIVYYADSAERLTTQVMQVGLVTVLLSASLLLINVLDHPFNSFPGEIKPEKMEFSVGLMERDIAAAIDAEDLDATLPCDQAGLPRDEAPDVKSYASGSTMLNIISKGRLVVGVSNSIPLFGELDPVSGVISGFDADLAREIAREVGLREEQIEFFPMNVEDRIPYLQQGIVDMVVLVMTITPERKELLEFSRPYFLAGQSILVEKTNRSISSLKELNGKRVCVMANSTNEAALRQLSPTTELVYRSDFPTCIAAMKRGEVDAVSSDDIVLAGYVSEDDSLVLAGGQFTQEPYGVAVPKGDTDFVELINKVINDMIDDGRWGKLYYQYLGDIPGLASVKDAKDRLPFGVDE